MIKINRRLVLLLILMLIMGVLSGCKNKAPEGFTQEFYDDIVKTSREIMKDIPNIKRDDVLDNTNIKFQSYSDFCDKYYSDYEDGNLTITEEKAIKSLTSVVLGISTDLRLYYKGERTSLGDYTQENIKELSNLLEIDIEYDF